MRTALASLLLLAPLALGCAGWVQVDSPPCDCSCRFSATAPQVGKGCYVSDDVLICPLVRRTLDIEPAYPSEDPRCERLEDGSLQCTIVQEDGE